MQSISLAEAKAHLSAIVERVEAGESLCITKRGKAVVRLVPMEPARLPFDFEALRQHAKRMPVQPQSTDDFMRQFRDEERY